MNRLIIRTVSCTQQNIFGYLDYSWIVCSTGTGSPGCVQTKLYFANKTNNQFNRCMVKEKIKKSILNFTSKMVLNRDSIFVSFNFGLEMMIDIT